MRWSQLRLLVAAHVALWPTISWSMSCDKQTQTAVDECLANESTQADAELARYKAAAVARIRQEDDQVQTLQDFSDADNAWARFREAECNAVFDKWANGSIRIQMSLTCSIELTRTRTHEIWANWLTFFDSTPPILPEPSAEQ